MTKFSMMICIVIAAVCLINVMFVDGAGSQSRAQKYNQDNSFIHGVSFGGWMVMEGWMFDQMPMDSQLGWINSLIEKYDKQTAIQATQNHWNHYLPTELLDDLQAFGITDVRLPLGYWCFEPPVGSENVYDYGFQTEGFVTGCLNHVEPMLFALQDRGINVLIDLHAIAGCSSACESYAGLMCNDGGSWFWAGSPPEINGGCDGSPASYNTSRDSTLNWYTIGQNTIVNVAQWIVTMNNKLASRANKLYKPGSNSTSGFITGFELLNEPGLNSEDVQPQVLDLTATMVPVLQGLFRDAYNNHQARNSHTDNVQIPQVRVVVNFITDWQGTGQWLLQQIQNGNIDTNYIAVDYHAYFNFGDFNPSANYWFQQQCASDSCCDFYLDEYARQGIHMFIGEWSTAVSYDNITCFSTSSDGYNGTDFAGISYSNQVANFVHYHSTLDTFDGAYFWTARMGSGWNAVPTSQNPNGTQVAGSAYDQSLHTYQYCQWSLTELMKKQVVSPIDKMNINAECLCECTQCNTGEGFF